MAIEYQTLTFRTLESSNDNIAFTWCELSSTHLPDVSGVLKQVAIQCRSSSNSTFKPTPLHLGVWERRDDGNLILLGCSTNKVEQAVGALGVWEFNSIPFNCKKIVLAPLSEPNGAFNDVYGLSLASRCLTGDTDGCSAFHVSVGRKTVLPDITFTVEHPVFIPDDEPEPEPEQPVELREIDIRQYWPPVVRDTDEFQQIAAAENPVFNKLQACIYRVLQDVFVHDATDNGVRRWEAILNIEPAAGDTLDDRKSRILTYLSIKLPYTWRVLEQMLTEFLGDDLLSMRYVNDMATLTINVNGTSDENVRTIKTLLGKVLPENIEFAIYNQREVNENE